MKKIFFMAAVMITAALGFTACDKKDIDENFDFSHTSWESSIDNDEMSGTLTLTFTDDKNGIVKGDFEDKDSKKYTAYQTFTYEAGMGKGTLHIDSQFCIMGNQVSRLFSGPDVSFSLGRNSKTLDVNIEDEIHSFASTVYEDIHLPVMDTPEPGTSNVNLTKNMLLGNWNIIWCWAEGTYQFTDIGKDFIGKIEINESDIFNPRSMTSLVKEEQLYPVIQNPGTVVYYAENNHTTVKYYLQFDADEYYTEYGMYNATLMGADGNFIFSGYIEKK